MSNMQINKQMETNLKRNFEFIFSEMIDCEQVSKYELIIRMRDGRTLLYDDLEETIRTLPRDSYNMSEQECRNEFGLRLRKLIWNSRMNQGDLAEKLGVSPAVLSGYITGKHTPSFYIVDKIAKILGCSVDEFRYL